MHNWYINQDIVCIKTHSMGMAEKGEVHNIKSLRKPCCNVQIDIGKKYRREDRFFKYVTVCRRCGKETDNGTDNTAWISEKLFAPLDSLTDISEIEEILSQPIETLFKIN